MSDIILENKKSGFNMEDISDTQEEVILCRSSIGQGTQIPTRHFSSDDFRKLADYLDKIRGECSE